jgi:hypothetical protein
MLFPKIKVHIIAICTLKYTNKFMNIYARLHLLHLAQHFTEHVPALTSNVPAFTLVLRSLILDEFEAIRPSNEH